MGFAVVKIHAAAKGFIYVSKRMCDAPAIFFAFRRYFELYFVFLMPSVGWWDCLLGALKAHKETSAHDYQGWLQARPIREDIKKHFDLVFMFIIPQIFRISQMRITSASEHIR